MFGGKQVPVVDPVVERLRKLVEQQTAMIAQQSIIPMGVVNNQSVLGAGAHTHSIDALAYSAMKAASGEKQLTPKQKAMMGVYNPDNDGDETFFFRLIAMRMRIREGENIGADHMAIYNDRNEKKVHMMVVHKGQSVIMTEEEAIFPSDSTIAALHLMLGNPAR